MGSFEKLNGECEFKALAEAVKDELAVTDVMKACYAKNGYVMYQYYSPSLTKCRKMQTLLN
jgi:hypothetical protein